MSGLDPTRGRTHRPKPSPRPAAAFGTPGYWIVFTVIIASVGLINLFFAPDRFADFQSYVLYVNGLVYFRPPSWIYFEGLSNLFFLGIHWITRSVFSAIVVAHYALGVVFVLLMAVAFPPRRSTWPALLFTFAMLGPLLAFVTIRATPAYFLIAIAVRLAAERRMSFWICLASATLFHISSLLAAVPLLLLYFDRDLPTLLRSGRSRAFYLVVLVLIFAVGATLTALSDSLTFVVQSIPLIAKYDTYTNATNDETQLGHFIFLGFVVFLTAAFLSVRTETSSKLTTYVLVSFAIYIIMFFSTSPVAAFRQAPFWVLPMVFKLPWNRLGVRPITSPLFILLCVGLFVFQFSYVYH